MIEKAKYSKKETIAFIEKAIRIRKDVINTEQTKLNDIAIQRDLKVLDAVRKSDKKTYNDCNPSSLAKLFNITI